MCPVLCVTSATFTWNRADGRLQTEDTRWTEPERTSVIAFFPDGPKLLVGPLGGIVVLSHQGVTNCINATYVSLSMYHSFLFMDSFIGMHLLTGYYYMD